MRESRERHTAEVEAQTGLKVSQLAGEISTLKAHLACFEAVGAGAQAARDKRDLEVHLLLFSS